jgi:hypothetical protein
MYPMADCYITENEKINLWGRKDSVCCREPEPVWSEVSVEDGQGLLGASRTLKKIKVT